MPCVLYRCSGIQGKRNSRGLYWALTLCSLPGFHGLSPRRSEQAGGAWEIWMLPRLHAFPLDQTQQPSPVVCLIQYHFTTNAQFSHHFYYQRHLITSTSAISSHLFLDLPPVLQYPPRYCKVRSAIKLDAVPFWSSS